jgi:hypothetical protein
MKNFIVVFALLISIASFNNKVEAQNISVSINTGHQPAWGPVGYDYAGYYYFPDIDCYYDVNMSLFYYFDRGRWISARYLPYAYRHYDLYRLYKMVLNVRNPWRYHDNHYRDYARYRGYHNQVVIRDSRDRRYYSSRNNKVDWYSKDKSQRNYKYNYNNYNGTNKNSSYNNNQPKRNSNNNDKKFDNSRNGDKNNSRANKDTKTKRSSSGNGNYRSTSNERSGRR